MTVFTGEWVSMTAFSSQIRQTDPPRPPIETLPTMYDLPSEAPEEPGLPDEFHYLQPQLLSATFRLSDYTQDWVFTAGDLNLYYDARHPLWYKRPDWFAVVGVSRLYREQDMRLSYVLWQEGVSPSVIVEFISPSTEDEDLGRTPSSPQQPPTQWQVYEQTLRVPYYIVFDRYTDQLQAFTLVSGVYEPIALSEPRVWMPTLNIGIGLWQGTYEGITRQWLRWYGADGAWILTDAEQAQRALDEERAAREVAERRAAQLAEQLRALGVEPE